MDSADVCFDFCTGISEYSSFDKFTVTESVVCTNLTFHSKQFWSKKSKLNLRNCYVGARSGHFPQVLALITTAYSSPAPAIIFQVFLKLWKLDN